MFYDQESNYKTLDDLIKAIDDYIYYYNYDRIKVKLKGLSPVNYRLQSSNKLSNFWGSVQTNVFYLLY